MTTIQTRQRHTIPKVPQPQQQQKEESQRCGITLTQPLQTLQPQEYERELEAITIALNGAIALLKKITTGTKCLIPALLKMVEAALSIR